MAVQKNTLLKSVKELKSGEHIYINAISLSNNAIDALRTMIQAGVLVPPKTTVEVMYSDVKAVMDGVTILPQLTYTKA